MIMISGSFIRRASLLVSVTLFATMATAAALNIEDVKNLMRSGVGEDVIINMAKSDGRLFITIEEAEELRRMGASENLITALRPRPTSIDRGTIITTTPTTPTVVSSVPAPTTTTTPTTTEVVFDEVAEGSPVSPAPIMVSGAYPPRYDKEGWLSISNRDWMPYYVNINRGDKRIFISRAPNGGLAIQSGENIIVNLRKDTYKTYGESGNKLEVKIRENETSTLDFNPFGVVGNSGLSGVTVSRDRVRSEILFNNFSPAPAIVVQEPSVIVVPSTPPPVYYYRPPYYRPYRDGFYFNYRRW